MSHAFMPKLSLAELFAEFDLPACIKDKDVQGVSLDSRTCKQGYVYFALPGLRTHGIRYVSEVLDKGVLAIVVHQGDDLVSTAIRNQIAESQAFLIEITDLPGKVGEFASRFFGNDQNDTVYIGITGTDGKTSVSHFVSQALNAVGCKSGVIGTICWGVPGHYQPSLMTTPDPIELHRQIYELRAIGARFVSMEVSSHALHQRRVTGIEFDVAVLTNLAQDHLDYHGTLENYASAKQLLFTTNNLKSAVLNIDDEFGRKLADVVSKEVRIITYSLRAGADFTAKKVVETESGLTLLVQTGTGDVEIKTCLIGDFNAKNVLTTMAVLKALEVKSADFIAAISALIPVKGRMEKFQSGQSPVVIVDYAHTAQALESVLRSLNAYCKGDLWCVFGCGGERDRGKRAQMARAAESFAENVVVTNDNPRNESPEGIVRDIMLGFNSASKVAVILDRKSAIQHAIESAGENDWVLIAGKGHEDYQLMAGKRLDFSDRQVVSDLLRECA